MANQNDRGKWESRLRSVGLTGRLPDRLTQKIADAVLTHPIGERYQLADGRGLALCVAPDGSASYLLQTRNLAAQARRCGLGSAAVVTLETARAEADRLRTIIKAGGDPVAEKHAARAGAREALGSTVKAYAEGPYKTHKKNKKAIDSTVARILAS